MIDLASSNNVQQFSANGSDLIQVTEGGLLDPQAATDSSVVLAAMLPSMLSVIQQSRELLEEE